MTGVRLTIRHIATAYGAEGPLRPWCDQACCLWG